MIVHRYFCILCGFVVQTVQEWKGVMECPSCHVKVEVRSLPLNIIEEVPDAPLNEALVVPPKEQMN